MNKKRTLLASLSFALFFSISALANIEVGQSAPDFELRGHDGKTYKLSELKGKYVVLEWFNNDCPYVKKHYHEDFKNMQNLQSTWIEKGKKSKEDKDSNLVWLSIVSSAPGKQGHVNAEEATEIKKERQAHMSAILLDTTGKVGHLYAAKTTPHMFIVDPEGKLRYQGAIDDQPTTQLSSLKKANNYVSNALTALFDGKRIEKTSTRPYGCSVKYQQ